MQPNGIEFLRPIRKLVTESRYLNLSFDDINVYYTKYINNHKHTVHNGEQSIDNAVQEGLTPGKIVFKFTFVAAF